MNGIHHSREAELNYAGYSRFELELEVRLCMMI